MMNFRIRTIYKALFAFVLTSMLVLTSVEAAEHDCHHSNDGAQHDCALCLLSNSSAENSATQTLDPPPKTVYAVSLLDATPRSSELPRSHAPRSPPTL